MKNSYDLEWKKAEIADMTPEALKMLPYSGIDVPTLSSTWWFFDEPGMDNILEIAKGTLPDNKSTLDGMFERLKVSPVIVNEKKMLFLARFELPQFQQPFKYPDAIFRRDAIGFIDFLIGFPYGCIELAKVIGEFSTDPEKFKPIQASPDDTVPPYPEEIFEDPEPDKIVFNYLYLSENSEEMATNLAGTKEPENFHWWLRVNLLPNARYPVPGEFVSLAVRMPPYVPWWQQETHPFLFSGNWMDTVFYSSGTVKRIIPATDDRPYNLYIIERRGEEVQAKTSDFSEYNIGERVTILKNIATQQPSMTWEMLEKYKDTWQILPIEFYKQELIEFPKQEVK